MSKVVTLWRKMLLPIHSILMETSFSLLGDFSRKTLLPTHSILLKTSPSFLGSFSREALLLTYSKRNLCFLRSSSHETFLLTNSKPVQTSLSLLARLRCSSVSPSRRARSQILRRNNRVSRCSAVLEA